MTTKHSFQCESFVILCDSHFRISVSTFHQLVAVLRQLSFLLSTLLIDRPELPLCQLPTTRDSHQKKQKKENTFPCLGQHNPSHFVFCCHFSLLLSSLSSPLLFLLCLLLFLPTLLTSSSLSISLLPPSCFSVSCAQCSMNVLSECPLSGQCVCDGVCSVVNELLFLAGGVCLCSVVEKPGQFVQ